MTPEDRLASLGLVLPRLQPPRGRYIRSRRAGDLIYLAGHGPPADPGGQRPTGRIGAEHDLDAGYAFARAAGLALLATLRDDLGQLSRIAAVVKILGMVNVAPGFDATPAVIDGCSDVLIQVLGQDVGAHSRSAIGVAALPYGIPVEIEMIVAVRAD